MRYRRLSARFLRSTAPPRFGSADRVWEINLLALAPPIWRPAVDACESPRGLVVVVEIAGVDDDDLDVTLFVDALVVEGERRLPPCGGDGRYDRAEIREGPFRVEVPLPFPVDDEGVEATYERGLLRIDLPRMANGSAEAFRARSAAPRGRSRRTPRARGAR